MGIRHLRDPRTRSAKRPAMVRFGSMLVLEVCFGACGDEDDEGKPGRGS